MADEKIAAVVVTYNRLQYLKACLEGLRRQSRKLDEIIVINNDSTDGSLEWLSLQNDITVITQRNVGGAGGFNRGIKEAFIKGYNWMWIMDDDVKPKINALKTCMDLLATKYRGSKVCFVPMRLWENTEKISDTSLKSFNLSSLFGKNRETLFKENSTVKPDYSDVVAIEDFTFEGVLLDYEAIAQVGFPHCEFFIYGDDTDYSQRIKNIGYRILHVGASRIERMNIKPLEVLSWKRRYIIRNTIWLYRIHGHNNIVRILKPLILGLRYIIGGIKNGYYFNNPGLIVSDIYSIIGGIFNKLPTTGSRDYSININKNVIE